MKPTELCRTWLFLPGADRDALLAARDSGADVLGQELEDFTTPELRPAARGMAPEIYAAWKEAGCVTAVRVNRLDGEGHQDLAAVMSDGVEKVCLAEAGVSVDEERVVVAAGLLGHGEGRGVGEPVRGADDEIVEGVFGDEP